VARLLALQVDRSSFLGNCVRGNVWLRDYDIAKLHKPVDRTEWEMTPQTYNAYYNPSNNEIVLPAAAFILPGIADSLIDDALVYGYAAARRSATRSRTASTTRAASSTRRATSRTGGRRRTRRSSRRAARIVRQFDGYVATGDLHVNGRRRRARTSPTWAGCCSAGTRSRRPSSTRRASRSAADAGAALLHRLGAQLDEPIRPENIAVRVKSDVHAPSFWRTNGRRRTCRSSTSVRREARRSDVAGGLGARLDLVSQIAFARRAAIRALGAGPARVERPARRSTSMTSGAWSEGVGLPLRASRSISPRHALRQRLRHQQEIDPHADVPVEVAAAVVPPGEAPGSSCCSR
jgi:hypothetical protein